MNRIIKVSKSKLNNNLNFYKKSLIIRIEGKNIKSYEEYIKKIEDELNFPTKCNNSIDIYIDWLTDLSWINSKNILIIFNDYTEFLSGEPRKKTEIINIFKEVILPFWEQDVTKFVVRGKKKNFNVLLVCN